MKIRYKINVLFLINAIIVGVLSLGAGFFTLVPLLMGFTEPQRILSVVTQNYAMIGLWIIYFANVIFLPITLKKQDKKWKIIYIVFLIGVVIFVIYITGLLQCWEAILSKFFGMDYNDRIRCLREN